MKQLMERATPSLKAAAEEKAKIRIRTDEEIEQQARGLKEIRDMLNALGIPYYIGGGALLGAIRDGDFIKWDFDVDIETKMESIRPKQEALISALRKSGFQIDTHNPSRTDFKIIAVKYGVKYEIVGYLKMGGNRYRRRCYYPDVFCQEGSEILLRGEKYNTYHLPEKYLEWFYGDWKTPLRKANYYYTVASRTGPVALTLMEIMILYQRLAERFKFSNE